eukprot:1189744-Prorocentrum_minimum.AAC.6
MQTENLRRGLSGQEEGWCWGEEVCQGVALRLTPPGRLRTRVIPNTLSRATVLASGTDVPASERPGQAGSCCHTKAHARAVTPEQQLSYREVGVATKQLSMVACAHLSPSALIVRGAAYGVCLCLNRASVKQQRCEQQVTQREHVERVAD